MSDTMHTKVKILIIALTITGILMIVAGSYAYLTTTILGTKTNVIKVGSLDVILDESLGNGISMENAYAITDEAGLATPGSSFSIVNNGKSDICYEVYLDDMDLEETEIRVNDKYIKYSLDKGSKIGKAKQLTNIGANPNRLLDSGDIKSKERIDYKLRLWFNSEENGDYSGQVFKGKLRVEVIQCKITEPEVMMKYNAYSTSDYHSNTYKSKVTSITMKTNTLIPETALAVENGKGNYWDVSESQNDSVIAYIESDGAENYKVTIGRRGGVFANPNSGYLFYNFTALTELDLSDFDTSKVTDMSELFGGCSNLKTLDVSTLDTSNVENMFGMFSDCQGLTSLDVSNFNTSNVTNMQSMFAGCTSLQKLDLKNFNTSNVTNMAAMFTMCFVMEEINLTSFDTTNVTTMYYMFERCGFHKFDMIISVGEKWTTANADIRGMFEGCATDHVTVV